MTLKEYDALYEALRIVKKGEDKPADMAGKIASVGGYDIILTKHVHHTRDSEDSGRGEGLLRKTYKTVVQKLVDLKKKISDGYYHLIYKAGEAYNDMVVNIKGHEIKVVTVIQHNRPNPNSYHVKPGDTKIVLEQLLGEHVETIDLGDLSDLLEDKHDLYLTDVESARQYLKNKYPKYEIVHNERDFKSQQVLKYKSMKIHIAGAETASGKDAVMFDIEY